MCALCHLRARSQLINLIQVEMCFHCDRQGRYMHEATRAMPIIGDGDTGYGNALNVKRTVKGYAAAGFAGILIEDQVRLCAHAAYAARQHV